LCLYSICNIYRLPQLQGYLHTRGSQAFDILPILPPFPVVRLYTYIQFVSNARDTPTGICRGNPYVRLARYTRREPGLTPRVYTTRVMNPARRGRFQPTYTNSTGDTTDYLFTDAASHSYGDRQRLPQIWVDQWKDFESILTVKWKN